MQSVNIRHLTVDSALTRVAGHPDTRAINPYVGVVDALHQEVGVKSNLVDVLRTEKEGLSPSVTRIWWGTITDPYQAVERDLQLTRQSIRQLAASDRELAIITTEPLVVRDVDLLRLPRNLTVHILIPTLDETIREWCEPGSTTIHDRLATVSALRDEGISVFVGVAPLVQRVSDSTAAVRATAQAALAAGALSVWGGDERLPTEVSAMQYVTSPRRHVASRAADMAPPAHQRVGRGRSIPPTASSSEQLSLL